MFEAQELKRAGDPKIVWFGWLFEEFVRSRGDRVARLEIKKKIQNARETFQISKESVFRGFKVFVRAFEEAEKKNVATALNQRLALEDVKSTRPPSP